VSRLVPKPGGIRVVLDASVTGVAADRLQFETGCLGDLALLGVSDAELLLGTEPQ
jgi:hypothetical protein